MSICIGLCRSMWISVDFSRSISICVDLDPSLIILIDCFRSVSVCDLYRSILIYIYLCRSISICGGLCRSISICINLCRCVLIYIDLSRSVLIYHQCQSVSRERKSVCGKAVESKRERDVNLYGSMSINVDLYRSFC